MFRDSRRDLPLQNNGVRGRRPGSTTAQRYCLTVYGRGRIEPEGAADLMIAIGGVMAGTPLPDSMRPVLEERAKAEKRIVLRVTPESYFP